MAKKAQDLSKNKGQGRPGSASDKKVAGKSISKLRKEIVLPVEPDRNYHCCACGLQTNDAIKFSPSNSVIYAGNNHRLPICRTCTNDMFMVFLQDYGDHRDVYRRICMLWDIYYDDTIADTANKEADNKHKMTKYIGKLSLPKYVNKTYADTIKEDILRREDSSFSGLTPSVDELITKEIQDFWGEGFSTEDYQFLQKTYENWTNQVTCSTPSEKALMKRICFNELQTHKALVTGDSTYKLTEELNKILNSANLQPKQNKTESLSDTHTLGTMIKKWEDEEGKPIPEPLPEFKDVDGIKKYLSVWFYGHLCKMIGRKNKWSKLYEDEISQYTVNKPEYNSEDEDIDYETIFGVEE